MVVFTKWNDRCVVYAVLKVYRREPSERSGGFLLLKNKRKNAVTEKKHSVTALFISKKKQYYGVR